MGYRHTALFMAAIPLLLCGGCKAKKAVSREDYQMASGVTVSLDSSVHRWGVQRVTIFRPDGTPERVEEQECHVEQKAVARRTDTVYVHAEREAVKESKPDDAVAKQVKATAHEIKGTAQAGAWRVWGMATIAIAIAAVFIIYRFSRR